MRVKRVLVQGGYKVGAVRGGQGSWLQYFTHCHAAIPAISPSSNSSDLRTAEVMSSRSRLCLQLAVLNS